jgi:hypothetical protein
LPLSALRVAGRLLKEVFGTCWVRIGVYKRLDAARCMLDDWAMVEYPDQKTLPNDQFFTLYYGGTRKPRQRDLDPIEQAKHIASLRQVKNILKRHYPDGQPVRAILKELNAAIKSLQSWN